jgi:hypothetical protein
MILLHRLRPDRNQLKHPVHLNAMQWDDWKGKEFVNTQYGILSYIIQICGGRDAIEESALVVRSKEDMMAQLEAQITRPKNFPFQEKDRGDAVPVNG